MRRGILLAFLLGPVSLLAATRPNILAIFTDNQGVNDMGCYGSEIPTPNIARLADNTLDLIPTFCEMAGLPSDDIHLDGRSLLPVPASGAAQLDRTFFWELGAHPEIFDWRASFLP